MKAKNQSGRRGFGTAATLGSLLGCLAVGLMPGRGAEAGTRLAVVAPAGYVPGLPVLLRIELRDSAGRLEQRVWDADAAVEVAQPGVSLSTNRVILRNGMGSGLVTFSGAADLDVIVRCNGLIATQALATLGGLSQTPIGGVLPGSATTWSGIIHVTNDVVVPSGHVLTIQPGTWVLYDGVASGTNGADLQVSGELRCLGTQAAPVVMTC